MKEVHFHLPKAFNDGRNAERIIRETLRLISTRFGGATVTEAQGFWSHQGHLYEEPVVRISVAVPSAEAEHRLKQIATKAAVKMEQLALYFVGMEGEVSIIDLPVLVPSEVAA